MAALVVFTALLFWVCVFLVVFTAQGTTPFDYFFGRYEDPPDLGVWKDFGIDSKTGLSREERWLLPGGQDSARLVRQVRYRDAVTHAIIDVEPEVRVRRRRVSARYRALLDRPLLLSPSIEYPMASATQAPRDVIAFFDSYKAALERHDVADVADHYAYPAHMVNDSGKVVLVTLSSREIWEPKITETLERYRRVDFAAIEVLNLAAVELSPLLAQATVQWGLYDSDGELLYDFDTTYVLGRFERKLRILQLVVQNELPRHHAYLEGRRRRRA